MTNREWIAAEFSKGIAAEESMATECRARAEAPPDPAMAVLYSQVAADDERHRAIVETIATRYGHTPSRGRGTGGIGEALIRLKDKVTDIGTTPLQHLADDLRAKADTIHWTTAWVHAFEAIGDPESGRELAAILTEDKTHLDALQEALNRLVEAGARSGEAKAS